MMLSEIKSNIKKANLTRGDIESLIRYISVIKPLKVYEDFDWESVFEGDFSTVDIVLRDDNSMRGLYNTFNEGCLDEDESTPRHEPFKIVKHKINGEIWDFNVIPNHTEYDRWNNFHFVPSFKITDKTKHQGE